MREEEEDERRLHKRQERARLTESEQSSLSEWREDQRRGVIPSRRPPIVIAEQASAASFNALYFWRRWHLRHVEVEGANARILLTLSVQRAEDVFSLLTDRQTASSPLLLTHSPPPTTITASMPTYHAPRPRQVT